eukprot:CAMPEP_0179440964 /NCGR_PEP_ID=MMETSP0799-20121207/24580_1 /TAXON_ID=46947 /ORGANISM="Geminigera cryophila, Strain CCMP2564" /LENGTH=93 /DNA_ID=CAMNT_0021224873 /DNA_START=388 /DNA_END=669 /DNA_ORIENTATION=+
MRRTRVGLFSTVALCHWRGAPTDVSFLFSLAQFQSLYGKKAAALYTQAGDYQKTARFYYKKAEDTYYQANNWAAYDDWRRARDQWDYFYSRNR